VAQRAAAGDRSFPCGYPTATTGSGAGLSAMSGRAGTRASRPGARQGLRFPGILAERSCLPGAKKPCRQECRRYSRQECLRYEPAVTLLLSRILPAGSGACVFPGCSFAVAGPAASDGPMRLARKRAMRSRSTAFALKRFRTGLRTPGGLPSAVPAFSVGAHRTAP